jgi:hypothetical protein
MLWAWESPQDLRFVDPHHAGVAYLAATLFVSGNEVRFVRRHQPLQTRPGTPLMAVFRIESNPGKTPSGKQAAETILHEFAIAHLTAIQIDFDARASERPFYRALLADLRTKLGASIFLSITALASWCDQHSWLESLPIDEAVPMLFRMGADRGPVLTLLSSGRELGSKACRASSGVSTDEPLPTLKSFRRTYIFHPGSWDAASAANYLQ